MENNKCTPKKLTFMFKNNLRTFEVEIREIFQNIQPQLKS